MFNYELGGSTLKLEFSVINKNLIVRFNGELDHHTAKEIREKIDSTYSDNLLKNIVIDLSNLQFMDSSGIGLIMGRYKLASNNNGKIYLINVSDRVKKILNMSGILKIVKIIDNLSEIN